MTETTSRERRRAIGVLLMRRGEDPQNSTVTAEVAWGVTPFLVPRVTAGSEKEAISTLRTGLRNHRHRPLLLFDGLEDAEQERRRNMLATMLLSGAYAASSRDKLAQAVGGLPHSEQVLRAFDEIAHALYNVEAGNHASRYLVPDFDCDATRARVYVPAHDPRYKRAMGTSGGHVDAGTPVIYPGLEGVPLRNTAEDADETSNPGA